MANRVAYMNYAIYFTDKAEFDAARSGGVTIQTAPKHAAEVFDLPFPVPGGSLGSKGMYYFSPYTPGSQLNQNSGVFVDETIDSFVLPGGSDPFGNVYPDTDMVWMGVILLQGNGAPSKVPQTPTTPTTTQPIPPPQHVPPGYPPPAPPSPPGPPPQPPPVPISQRRWAIGFELPDAGETNGTPLFNCVSREASRTAEGFGMAIRGPADLFSMPLNQLTPLASAPASWERIYIRLRRLPSGNAKFWQSHGTPSDASGIILSVTSAGAFLIQNNSSVNVTTDLMTTPAFTLNTWYRLDIIVRYNTAGSGGAGTFQMYRNGTRIVDLSVPVASGGLGQGNAAHVRTEVGSNAPTLGLEMDVDDWINAEPPSNFGAIDWVSGSHVMRIYPTGFAASHNAVAWPGDYRVLLQNPASSSTTRLVSTTSGARIAVTTDAEAGPVTQFGVAAMTVGIYSSRASVDGKLGYSLAGGAAVLATITQSTSILFNSVLYRPVGLTPAAPPPYPPNSPALASIFPIELYHEKGASVGSSSVGLLMATMECLGAWGPEDGVYNDPTVPPIVRSTDVHNAPYIRYELAGKVTSPNRSVAIVGGTFPGNSLGRDINMPLPVHWWWMRRVTGSSSGVHHWHSSAVAPSNLNSQTVNPESLVRAMLDLSGQAKIQISGVDAQINLTGDTYQYIGICDPGMRYLLAGGFGHYNSGVTTAVNALQNPNFNPVAVFAMLQTLGSNPSTDGYWYRGPGHVSQNASQISGAETANVMSFGLGTITSQSILHPVHRGGVAYAAVRMVDPDCPDQGVVFQILNYTGNGGGARTIALTPLSARWPLLAVILPHNGTGIYRDPSHTGVNSSLTNGANTTTGITAGGIDSLTVGVSLNALNIVYDVFVIPGSPFGWNNGVFIPVAPCSACNDTFPCPTPNIPPGNECVDNWGLGQSTDLPYIPLTP